MTTVYVVSYLCRACETVEKQGFSARKDAEAFAARAECVEFFSNVIITAQERAFFAAPKPGRERYYPDLVHLHRERVNLKLLTPAAREQLDKVSP